MTIFEVIFMPTKVRQNQNDFESLGLVCPLDYRYVRAQMKAIFCEAMHTSCVIEEHPVLAKKRPLPLSPWARR